MRATNGGCLAREQKKGGLHHILGILWAAQHAARNAEHHWSMAFKQRGEGRFVAVGQEVAQQMMVANVSRQRTDDAAQVIDDVAQVAAGHAVAP